MQLGDQCQKMQISR